MLFAYPSRSTGGNGATDAGAVAVYAADGGLRSETLTCDGLLQIGQNTAGASVNPTLNAGRVITDTTQNAHGLSVVDRFAAGNSKGYAGVDIMTYIGGIANEVATFNSTSNQVTVAVPHALNVGDQVKFTTSGTLPSPLVAGTTYYVRTVVSATVITLAASAGGAEVDIAAGGSGTHKISSAPIDTIDHVAGEQVRYTVNVSSVSGLNLYSYFSRPIIVSGCGSARLYHFYAGYDSLSVGTLDSVYGAYFDLSGGPGTYKYSFQAVGSTARMVHEGPGVFGSTSYSGVDASAQLTVTSTTKGFLPPRMTTAQKNAISSPTAGLLVYDSTLGKLCLYNGSAWRTVTDS